MQGCPPRASGDRTQRTSCASSGPSPYRKSWSVVHEFVDRLSGKTADREQFQLMFHSASVRGFDVLLFWSLDRLSREGTVATLNHLQRLDSYGVGYRSYTEQYLDSTGMFKEAVIGILAAVARQERVRLSERTIAGLQRARARGRIGGRPRTEHDPRAMAKLTALRLSGASIRRIATELGLSKTTVARLVRGQPGRPIPSPTEVA
jgi:DNA invertase Pin-like site-specific DNA recombinase